jgi:hypothetical protein
VNAHFFLLIISPQSLAETFTIFVLFVRFFHWRCLLRWRKRCKQACWICFYLYRVLPVQLSHNFIAYFRLDISWFHLLLWPCWPPMKLNDGLGTSGPFKVVAKKQVKKSVWRLDHPRSQGLSAARDLHRGRAKMGNRSMFRAPGYYSVLKS